MIITKIEQQKNNVDRRSVFIDKEFCFGIDKIDAERLQLHEGMELLEPELCNIYNTVLFESCKASALKILSRMEYTSELLAEKLYKKGYGETEVNKVLSFLREYNYLNDDDYCKRYISECIKVRKYGRYRIESALIQKRISSEIIRKYLSEIDFEKIERNNLAHLVPKKINKKSDNKDILKVKRHCINKGYDYSIVDWVIKCVIKGEKLEFEE